MKNFIFILLLSGFSQIAVAQDKPHFSDMEMNHVRVATPGLFSKRNFILFNLDSLAMNYSFPLPGGKVISDYGTRGGHSGTDIKTFAKDTIRAVFDGIVRMSKMYGGYGNIIVIRHPGGLETVYSHNFQNFVRSGDRVKAGQPIALTGRTGRATTEHVHFETRINGQHFNPGLLFDMKTQTLRRDYLLCLNKGNSIIVKVVKSKEVPPQWKPLSPSLYALPVIQRPVWNEQPVAMTANLQISDRPVCLL